MWSIDNKMEFEIPTYTYRVKNVVRVVDGDTVDIDIDLGFYLTARKRIRMLDIDTDELRGGTIETKARANMAKERLEVLLSTGDVYIKTKMDATGKYGRLLGTFYVVVNSLAVDINAKLVAEGFEKGTIV